MTKNIKIYNTVNISIVTSHLQRLWFPEFGWRNASYLASASTSWPDPAVSWPSRGKSFTSLPSGKVHRCQDLKCGVKEVNMGVVDVRTASTIDPKNARLVLNKPDSAHESVPRFVQVIETVIKAVNLLMVLGLSRGPMKPSSLLPISEQPSNCGSSAF